MIKVCVVRPTSKVGASAYPRQWPLYYDAGHATIAHQIGNSALTAASPCMHAVCHYSYADNRSILVLTSSANTRVGLSERRVPTSPIRTPEWSSHLSVQRQILFTQSRGTTEHERQLFRMLYKMLFNTVQNAVFYLMHLPPY